MHRAAPIALAAYIATIPTANWAVQHYGMVPVGLGYLAPAGVYLVGAALVLRDLARESAGRWPVAAAITVGAALSWWLATPALALASCAAFALSEALDMAVYEPLRRRGLLVAMAASNAVGLAVDSLLFLWLAFGSLQFLPGQLLGKTWMTLTAIATISLWRRTRTATA
ncbi:VUT family protein [Streptomyces sp. CB03911]|uniref:VUT family protein n=1 Tax=Streptomyces sp. CB03911 TaxID=1804758 RepID=UPI00093E2575|nr:VUT family protein [Streptomyces sp. CB03911]OKI16558.1 beta-carotene 15,15'-monooxygenase [Streptomyces sp. CB03911]